MRIRGKPPVVLLAEDEADTRKLVKINLEVRGYRVLLAEDGLEALSVFEKHTVDLVLLNLLMPGLNGYQVCEMIRSSSRVPIILVTAHADEGNEARAYECGADQYLRKPFSVDDLIGSVRAALPGEAAPMPAVCAGGSGGRRSVRDRAAPPA